MADEILDTRTMVCVAPVTCYEEVLRVACAVASILNAEGYITKLQLRHGRLRIRGYWPEDRYRRMRNYYEALVVHGGYEILMARGLAERATANKTLPVVLSAKGVKCFLPSG